MMPVLCFTIGSGGSDGIRSRAGSVSIRQELCVVALREPTIQEGQGGISLGQKDSNSHPTPDPDPAAGMEDVD